MDQKNKEQMQSSPEFPTLADVRVDIDRVDGEIKNLFEQRMKLANRVAEIKSTTCDDIYKPDREAAIIARLTEGVEPSILKEYTALIRRIMEISRKYQYGRTMELRDCLDIDYSREAPVIRSAVTVEEELFMVEQALQQKDAAPIALSAREHYPAVAQLIMDGTVDAGAGVMEEIGVGVNDELHRILVEYPLYINHCQIVEDGGIRKKIVTFIPKLTVRETDNRIKLMFICPDRSGSLAGILSMIADYGINLTEIHSRPDRHQTWNYYFMLEIAANFLEKETQALLFQLKNETSLLRVLGSYSV